MLNLKNLYVYDSTSFMSELKQREMKTAVRLAASEDESDIFQRVPISNN